MYECNLPHEVSILFGFKLKVVKTFHAQYYLPGSGSNEQLGILVMLSTYSRYRRVLPLTRHLDWCGMTGSPSQWHATTQGQRVKSPQEPVGQTRSEIEAHDHSPHALLSFPTPTYGRLHFVCDYFC